MKILPTIGPISNSLKSIKILNKYSSIFRLNGSHNSIDWHKKTIHKIKKINTQNQILLDIPGVKPRTGNKDKIFIRKNQLVSFFYKKSKFNGLSIPLTHPLPEIKNILNFTISDGNFLFKIIKKEKNCIIAKSSQSFTLESKKGLNLPNSIYNDTINTNTICDDTINNIDTNDEKLIEEDTNKIERTESDYRLIKSKTTPIINRRDEKKRLKKKVRKVFKK